MKTMFKVPVYLTLAIGLPTAANSGQPASQPANATPMAATRPASPPAARPATKGIPVSFTTARNVSDFVLPGKNTMRFVDAYIRNNDEDLALIRQRSGRPFTIMDSVFKQYGLPPELKYLAVIESELKPTAMSRVGARGPWQLMAGTARDLGLKVNNRRDERINYYKSTKAAALYLRDLHREFNDWLLVLAAYNAGPLPVYKAIHRSHSRDFWALERYLPKESRQHVKRFIATAVYFQESDAMALDSHEIATL